MHLDFDDDKVLIQVIIYYMCEREYYQTVTDIIYFIITINEHIEK